MELGDRSQSVYASGRPLIPIDGVDRRVETRNWELLLIQFFLPFPGPR